MIRLDAIQIGRLALHTETAIKNHPESKFPTSYEDTFNEAGENKVPIDNPTNRESWEDELAELVDNDPFLPDYNTIEEDEMVEHLVQYIAWTVDNTKVS
jgi:hypothetical protein